MAAATRSTASQAPPAVPPAVPPTGTAGRELPLTSEPSLADLAPLTAEQPLAGGPPLTAEPSGRGGAEADEI